MDIRGVNFKTLVSISQGFIEIYPESEYPADMKPGLGEGLNKAALITLKNMDTSESKFNSFVKALERDETVDVIDKDLKEGFIVFEAEYF